MSIADEARAEAEQRWPFGDNQGRLLGGDLRQAFRDGAEWQASRKPEAAPSDTEPLTLWRVQYEDQGRDCDGTYLLTPHYVLAPHVDEAWNRAEEQFDTFEGSDTIGVYEARPATEVEASEWLASRTSQPVQVEVTDAMRERLAGLVEVAVQDRATVERHGSPSRAAVETVLAALGGGE